MMRNLWLSCMCVRGGILGGGVVL